MAISLSPQLIESMGFRQFGEGEVVVAAFHSIHVYQVQGFTVDQGTVLSSQAHLSGTAYTVAVGSSVNELTQRLLGNDLVNDEAAWAKEQRCTPPYVIIKFGPTAQHSCTRGHIQRDESSLTTYDCFTEAKDALRTMESRVLPSLVSALNCAFSSANNNVRIRAVTREVFGLTPDNVVLHDVRFEVGGSAYVSQSLPENELQVAMARTMSLAGKINPKVSRFFHLALQEEDPLKRFLYFFLSIEIETHAVFSSIDHSVHIASIVNTQARVRVTSSSFFEAQRKRWTTLRDRFVWCAICVWTHVTDSDVEDFKRLKKIRDDIAHGSIAAPPTESVRTAEKLAKKLQWLNT